MGKEDEGRELKVKEVERRRTVPRCLLCGVLVDTSLPLLGIII